MADIFPVFFPVLVPEPRRKNIGITNSAPACNSGHGTCGGFLTRRPLFEGIKILLSAPPDDSTPTSGPLIAGNIPKGEGKLRMDGLSRLAGGIIGDLEVVPRVPAGLVSPDLTARCHNRS